MLRILWLCRCTIVEGVGMITVDPRQVRKVNPNKLEPNQECFYCSGKKFKPDGKVSCSTPSRTVKLINKRYDEVRVGKLLIVETSWTDYPHNFDPLQKSVKCDKFKLSGDKKQDEKAAG